MTMILLLPLISLDCSAYQFDQGYVELWYAMPAADIFSLEEFSPGDTEINKTYEYRLVVYPESMTDSVVHEGFKRAVVKRGQNKDRIMDFIPVFLLPGRFQYGLAVNSAGDHWRAQGKIEIGADSILFFSSDLILSKKTRSLMAFARGGIDLVPMLDPVYSPADTLFSYLETYGLIPDSLFYTIRYVVADTAGGIVFARDFKKDKYNDHVFDTLSIPLDNMPAGKFKLHVSVFDPARNKMATRTRLWELVEPPVDLESMVYAYEIEMLLSPAEYRRFYGMNLAEKRSFAEKFWRRNDYWQYEKKIREADERFSTSNRAGHLTGLGKYYILNGPPDEIEYRPMEATGNPSQVWHYISRGLMVLFVDNDSDGDYELTENLDFEQDAIRDIPVDWIKN